MTRGNGRYGAVAAGHGETAAAAAEILADGGNAFDAAIAALWTACVAEPVLASPGGGGFMMALRDGRAHLFDFFVDTPRHKRPVADIEFHEIHADFGPVTQAFHIGRGAAATPGFVPGIFAVHDAFGTIPMRRLVEPAIRLAREGLRVTDFQAYLAVVVSPILTASPAARALFAPDGPTLPGGAIYRNPDLADAIEAVAREGVRLEREGELARAMLHGQGEAGHLSGDDLRDYRVEIREPLARDIGRARAFFNPPPSLGGSLIAAMFGELAGKSSSREPQRSLALAAAIDRIDRLWRERPEAIAALAGAEEMADGPLATRGTTHVSVVDHAGNAAAATVTNGEGNGHIIPGAGFMINNMLGEEDINPGGFHTWKPGVRLASMMAPTIAAERDGNLVALGSGGSNRIRTAVFQVLAGALLHGEELAEAVDRPRLHLERGRLDFEDLAGAETSAALCRAFPEHFAWTEPNMFFGGVHAVGRRGNGTVTGVGDRRRGGAFVVV
ncbi:MAG: gamma-glutamyltransferase [Hyphomicrobiales bacterium]|nr:gamma-glutamyltransferase [Hyphomicrobiales bacterium]